MIPSSKAFAYVKLVSKGCLSSRIGIRVSVNAMVRDKFMVKARVRVTLIVRVRA